MHATHIFFLTNSNQFTRTDYKLLKKVTFYTRPILNDNQNPGSHLSPFAKRQQKCFLIRGQAITGFGFFEAALDDRRCFTTNFTRFNRQSSIFFLVTQHDVFIAKCLFLGTVIFFSSSIQRVGSRIRRNRLTRSCLFQVNLETWKFNDLKLLRVILMHLSGFFFIQLGFLTYRQWQWVS